MVTVGYLSESWDHWPMRVALLFEHPEWTRELAAAMTGRGVEAETFDVGDLPFDPERPPDDFHVWLNRINTMPSRSRTGARVVGDAVRLLRALEDRGDRIVNGLRSHRIGCSKIDQIRLMAELGLRHPRTRIVDRKHDLPAAAAEIGFPLLVKPNLGGSGRGIRALQSEEALTSALGDLDFGVDGRLLVQEVIESADGVVHRIETMGSRILYGTAQTIQRGTFNYCAADGCSVGDDGSSIRFEEPDRALAAQTLAFTHAANADMGSLEYLIDDKSGQACFFDFNPFSNFADGASGFIGSDPNELLIDLVIEAATREFSVP